MQYYTIIDTETALEGVNIRFRTFNAVLTRLFKCDPDTKSTAINRMVDIFFELERRALEREAHRMQGYVVIKARLVELENLLRHTEITTRH